MESRPDIIDSLIKLGLSLNESRVYLKIVDFGSSKAGKLAKAVGIERSSCYQALNSLVNKGLVSYAVVGKTKFFQATSPKRILESIKEQEEMAKAIIPELYERHKYKKKEGQVRLFKGIKGVKSVLMDIIREGRVNRIFGGEGQLGDRLPTFKRIFVNELKKNRIRIKELIRNDREDDLNFNREVRLFPGKVKSPVVTNIFGDKIAMIIWTDEPEAIIIENKEAAASYRSIFDFMWNKAKK